MIKVLVVDDSKTALEVISSLLEEDSGIHVIGNAGDGNEAISFLKDSPEKPDVIILDIKMPLMDGFAAMEYIMMYQPTPILIVTMMERDEVITRAHSLGVFDIIQKPLHDGKEDFSAIGQTIIERVKQLAKGSITF